MPEAIGKLDGLRDIIHPSAPVLADYSVALVVLVCVTAGLFIYYLYRRYQQRRLSKARRYFHRLKQHSSTWNSSQCGDSIMTILRLYAGMHNVRMQYFPGLDASKWSALIKDCNRLRFSPEPVSKEILQGLMNQIETILWPRR